MKGAKTIQDFTLAPTIQSTVPEKHLRSGVQWQERLADPGSSRATRSQVDRHSALLTWSSPLEAKAGARIRVTSDVRVVLPRRGPLDGSKGRGPTEKN